MVDITPFPNYQDQAAGAIPVRLVTANGTGFYNASGSGGGSTPVAPYAGTALGYQQITAATLATAQNLTVPATATYALISCESGNVRWRDDGAAPTGAVGMRLIADQPPQIFSGDLAAVQFILATGSGSAILDVSYYK